MANGVIGASDPPAIAISDSPLRMDAAAEATASSPETHVDEIVEVRVETPSILPINVAAACGAHDPTAKGLMEEGPRSRSESKPSCKISIALVPTPITMGRGADVSVCSRLGLKRASFSATVGCRIGELRPARETPRFFPWIDIIQRIEIFHFSSDTAAISARIEKRDGANAAAPLHERIPKFVETNSVRRKHSHPCNNDTSSFGPAGSCHEKNVICMKKIALIFLPKPISSSRETSKASVADYPKKVILELFTVNPCVRADSAPPLPSVLLRLDAIKRLFARRL